MRKASAFTLIELLIVVAIIAILAAIAVPNFLEAQTRSKVSRVKSDMRSLVTAIEAYRIDHNIYPPNTDNGARGFPEQYNGQVLVGTLWVDISTPVAYITNAFLLDVFNLQANMDVGTHDEALFIYQNLGSQYCAPYSSAPEIPHNQEFSEGFCVDALGFYGNYRIGSIGPDRDYAIPDATPPTAQTPYDPTNGTLSSGNIWRGQNFTDDTYPDPDGFPNLIGDD
ncbi:prepilin-type N-terminal cleavage/methylation domain-containing protein [Candidatus Sumerlaeota bacterium]|nr:prepilin-type N-terminal cleavage/methylation domain-containing protein [Candidatus Sumerlaeota bacterium]